MRTHLLAVLAFVILALPVQPLRAQPSARAGLVNDVMRNYDLIRIRENRLADDGKLMLIRNFEAKEKSLKADLNRFRSQAATARLETQRERRRRESAERRLEDLRAEFSSFVAGVAVKDASWRLERETIRADTVASVSNATPERLAALERFADGERVEAYPTIRRLNQAQAEEHLAAAAVLMRENAGLATIMLAKGEARAADVLASWQEAARIDPKDFRSQMEVSRLAELVGNRQLALRAAKEAASLATRRESRLSAGIRVADLLLATNETQSAEQAYRRLLGEGGHNPSWEPGHLGLAAYGGWSGSLSNKNGFATLIRKIGDVYLHRRENGPALLSYTEALAVLRMSAQGEMISSGIIAGGITLDADGNVAWQSEEERARLDQDYASARRLLAETNESLGDAHSAAGALEQAVTSYTDALKVARALSRVDVTNISERLHLSRLLSKLGDVVKRQGRLNEAEKLGAEAVGIARTLVAQDPSNLVVRRVFLNILLLVGTTQEGLGKIRQSIQTQQELVRSLQAITGQAPDGTRDGVELATAERRLAALRAKN